MSRHLRMFALSQMNTSFALRAICGFTGNLGAARDVCLYWFIHLVSNPIRSHWRWLPQLHIHLPNRLSSRSRFHIWMWQPYPAPHLPASASAIGTEYLNSRAQKERRLIKDNIVSKLNKSKEIIRMLMRVAADVFANVWSCR